MSIRNAGYIIKEARLKAGYTQESLSDGICSLVALNKIENGKLGVSPSTFYTLMAKTGQPCEMNPIFEHSMDYSCWLALKEAKEQISQWDLDSAYQSLQTIQSQNYANNRSYYQEFLLHYAWLTYRNDVANVQPVINLCEKAIHFTQPDFSAFDFRQLQLSQIDIEIILLLANCYINLGKMDLSFQILSQIDVIIHHTILEDQYFNSFKILYEVVYAKYLFLTKDYLASLSHAKQARSLSLSNHVPCLRIESILLQYMNQFMLQPSDTDPKKIDHILYLISYLAPNIYTMLVSFLDSMRFPVDSASKEAPSQKEYPPLDTTPPAHFGDGIFDIYGQNVISIGVLIHNLRVEQKLSLKTISQGLCSISKLSKIENGAQNPDVLLAEALLNRLGLSERSFLFFGDQEESAFHELKYKLISAVRTGQTAEDALSALQQLSKSSKNPFILQHLYLFQGLFEQDTAKKISLFEQGLQITLPNFAIEEITDFRLSWTEASLINSLALCYSETWEFDACQRYYQSMIRYIQSVPIHQFLMDSTFSVWLDLYYGFLYDHKLYMNILILDHDTHSVLKHYCLNNASDIFYYTAMSYGFQHDTQSAIHYAKLSMAIDTIIGFEENATKTATFLKKQFDISI